MRCWGWHERPWISTLCAAFAAVVISAGAGVLLGAHVLPPAASFRSLLPYTDMSLHVLRLKRFNAPVKTAYERRPLKTATLRGVKDSPTCLSDRRLVNLDNSVKCVNFVEGLKLTPQDSLVANLLTL